MVGRYFNHEQTMKARDIMTSDPYVVTRAEPISRAAEIMRDLDVGIVPVVDNPTSRRLLGVITDRDITIRCAANKHDSGCAVADHMTGNDLHTVRPDDDVDTVLQMMSKEQVRRIPVVDSKGRCCGIISAADIARRAPEHETAEVIREVSQPTGVSSRVSRLLH